MANQQLDSIHSTIAKDPALKQRLDGVADKDAYVDLMVEVGKSSGNPISAADVKSATSSFGSKNGNGELSDQQLESVAGGNFFHEWYYNRFTSGLVKCS